MEFDYIDEINEHLLIISYRETYNHKIQKKIIVISVNLDYEVIHKKSFMDKKQAKEYIYGLRYMKDLMIDKVFCKFVQHHVKVKGELKEEIVESIRK